MTQAYIREDFVKSMPPPAQRIGVFAWTRDNLFSSWWSGALTVFGLIIVYITLVPFIEFTLVNAIWEGKDREACLVPEAGACWAYVKAKFGQFIYGRYPLDERWRVNIVFILGTISLIPFMIPAMPGKRLNALILFVVFPLCAFCLLAGGWLGLAEVETSLWGGLLLTIIVASTGMVIAFPLGVLLALGRRAEMPVIRRLSILFIEFWRGVPLITVLFMSSVVLPLFLPEGVTFDKLLRALIGVALFASAYVAEAVRGGLQAIPLGQYEGAKALGLRYWQMMGFVVLPQAIKHAIPALVNSSISLFKDTSLVLIIGLLDLLNVIQLSFTDPKWATPQTAYTGYIFAALIFWIFCFTMSRYSFFLERHMDAESKSRHG